MSAPPENSSPPRCPICNRPIGDQGGRPGRFAPFCSRRCADIDLGRWLKGGYAIPGTPADEAPDMDHDPSLESLESPEKD